MINIITVKKEYEKEFKEELNSEGIEFFTMTLPIETEFCFYTDKAQWEALDIIHEISAGRQ